MLDRLWFLLRGLRRQRTRSLLTVSGIAIGVASVVVIGSIGATGMQAVEQEMDLLGMSGLSVMAGTSAAEDVTLQTTDVDQIRRMPFIEEAAPVVVQPSQASRGATVGEVALWGIDSSENTLISLDVLSGRGLLRRDVLSAANVCLIDRKTARAYFGRDDPVGQTLTLLVGQVRQAYEVVGVVRPNSGIFSGVIAQYIPTLVYLPYTNVHQLTGTDRITQIAVRVSEGADLEEAARVIRDRLDAAKGQSGAVRTDDLARQRDQLSRMLAVVTLVLSAVAAISLVVAGLGVTTVMLVSVHERTREIGIKKAVGATDRQILQEFLAEAVGLSLCGSLLGLAAGVVLCLAGGWLIGRPLAVPGSTLLAGLGTAVAVGAVFGVYPAGKAARLRPVDALRRQ